MDRNENQETPQLKHGEKNCDFKSIIELQPGAWTEEEDEKKEKKMENPGRFQMIHSFLCKRPLCNNREAERG